MLYNVAMSTASRARRHFRSLLIRAASQRKHGSAARHLAPVLGVGPELFNYTSGRWLFNEQKRLEERRHEINLPALLGAAAACIHHKLEDVYSIRKIREGWTSRSFRITMKDGSEVIAQLPYRFSQPRSLAVASEVATMDLARQSIAVPVVYDYSCTTHNEVGSEYILMESVEGRPVADNWYALTPAQRVKFLSQIVDMETRLSSVEFPGYGSIFYEKDLSSAMRKLPLASQLSSAACLGPDMSEEFWFEEREALSIDRGPSTNAFDVVSLTAIKEVAWLKQHGRPRFPVDRFARYFTACQKSEPEDSVHHLEQFIEHADRIVPTDISFHRPFLRHPDLAPDNIFVTDNLDITGVVGWRQSVVHPVFLTAGIPSEFSVHSDAEFDPLIEPVKPTNLDGVSDGYRLAKMERYRARHMHFHYLAMTAARNSLYHRVLTDKSTSLRQEIYQIAGQAWKGNNLVLAGMLLTIRDNWQLLTDCNGSERCPLVFEDLEGLIEQLKELNGADIERKLARFSLGFDVDGWVTNEDYDTVKAMVAMRKEDAISDAKNEAEEALILKHWPFDDFHEKE